MISVMISGMGQQWRLDTPDPRLIGPWLAALFADVQPDARMPGSFTINWAGQ